MGLCWHLASTFWGEVLSPENANTTPTNSRRNALLGGAVMAFLAAELSTTIDLSDLPSRIMECDRTPQDDHLPLQLQKALNTCENGYIFLRLPQRHRLAVSILENWKLSYSHVSPFRVIRKMGIIAYDLNSPGR